MAGPTSGRRERRTDIRWGDGYLTTSSRTDGSTRLVARWPDLAADGRTVWRGRTFPDTEEGRDAATDHLRSVARLKRDRRYVPPSELTVAMLMEAYLERGEGRWKPSTYNVNRSRSEIVIVPAIGSLRVATLTTARLQHWIDDERRRKRGVTMIIAAGSVLTAALREAARLGIIAVNPAVGLRYPTHRPKPKTTWTPEEIAVVLADLRDDPRWSALYMLALTTGMRGGEILALRWSDLDLDSGILTVRRTVTTDRDGRIVMGSSTKSGRDRENIITPPVVAALRRWAVRQKEQQLAAPSWQGTGLVFTERGGTGLRANRWRYAHRHLVERTGVRFITLHQLRHTNATIDMQAGTNVKVISERLGHSTVRITLDTYSHPSRDDHRAAADALTRRMFPADETG